MNFRVQLDVFRGPLDLLLYLVRKHEIESTDLPLAQITSQFVEYLEILEQLNVDDVGEFLEMASTLAEIKSRMVLPRGGEEVEEFDNPREDLVTRLLDYKRYRDAASMLEEKGRSWQQRYARLTQDAPAGPGDMSQQAIHELELWDLVSAFGRIIRESQVAQPSSIVYDDTPLHVYMQRIHARVVESGKVTFSEMFTSGMHKSAMIGVFLAVLELVRHHNVRTEQPELHGEIWIVPGEDFRETLDVQALEGDAIQTLDLDGLAIQPK